MSKEEKEIKIEDGNTRTKDCRHEEKKPFKDENKNVDSEAKDNSSKEEGDVEVVKDDASKLKDENARLKDQLLRTMAEFDNYKKRTLKEKTELILNGGEKVIKAILPVLDDMERAIDNAKKADTAKAVEDGWELIYKKLEKTLETLGVKKIDTADKDFDVDFHEAVAMVPGMGDDKKGKVIDCVQSGYMLNDKVLRHAKVAVGQ